MGMLAPSPSRGGCGSPVEKRSDVIGEQLGLLVEEAVVGIRVDPQVGLGAGRPLV
jgi:hypothetical protein